MTIHQLPLEPKATKEKYSPEFLEWWKEYPLKKGKDDAWRVFRVITQPGGGPIERSVKDGGAVVGKE